ncbi:thiosulfate oxidation carrier complex protein SoxZ [Hyphomicrobium sp.]|uniref:thiosulfate oxidation carrier complex protein SoxZ n=1 Tax=Hyphomicrobium sp. TaxID=82 RepID=UPI000F9CEA50|nr:thiosulfate oxidation carrier complex protein SoxZ [Hyphomicrobium sp.]RUO98932.1 MAG: thiosulfate oxidation carrier complex protein SoxZ [Hyphomicrobium sp.]
MAATNPRIKLPDIIKQGDVIEVKTLVRHEMETGNRRDKNGKPIPRDIINSFVAKFDGREVFRAEFGPGISANPYLAFQMRVPGPGIIEVTWTDDDGVQTVATAPLNIA